MYSARWTQGRLRQGDIVGPILYPKLKGNPQQRHNPEGWGGDANVNYSLEMPAEHRYAVVITHDCDFTAARRDQFLLARINNFGRDVTDEQRAEIRMANDAVRIENEVEESDAEVEGSDAEVRFEYLDTFVVSELPGHLNEEMLVNFSTIFPWPKSMIPVVLDLKRAEMEHQHRIRLRQKLGFYFAREAEDEPDERKVDAPSTTVSGP